MEAKHDSTTPFAPRILASKRYRWTTALLFTILLFYLHTHDFSHHQSTRPSDSHSSTRVDWSQFAYTQYVTNSEYLCNSVMFFEALNRLGSRADRVLMYPAGMWNDNLRLSIDTRLLIKARDEYNVKLVPIKIQRKEEAEFTWADSYTKFLAFNQTQYNRVLSIDSDVVLLQNMDELFLLPPAPVAMPRAYWLLPNDTLSSQVMLIQPSKTEFARIMDAVESSSITEYDMEIANNLYRDKALILPHRPYDLITGEFRRDTHNNYLGSETELWDPVAVLNEAKLVHFSDWPLPKPWQAPDTLRLEHQPNCTTSLDGTEDCAARVIWNSLYSGFKAKRKEICP
ncbi:nucleotide-diphospho-sugar transferase [Fusarium flagelliforme]|uniref:nucleotide-diphospho-sugar transferase n=1 Tax=Fusarium flagelliforme TaxID=2675880 RepID=UPI001E8DFF3C|nr:nucleotide-diphospho-sugar transferase [Fusarium flagelliforme]KAH7183166.1 nucleotide-diphospho-sugar transferase [Fusarium flagelliforme]